MFQNFTKKLCQETDITEGANYIPYMRRSHTQGRDSLLQNSARRILWLIIHGFYHTIQNFFECFSAISTLSCIKYLFKYICRTASYSDRWGKARISYWSSRRAKERSCDWWNQRLSRCKVSICYWVWLKIESIEYCRSWTLRYAFRVRLEHQQTMYFKYGFAKNAAVIFSKTAKLMEWVHW